MPDDQSVPRPESPSFEDFDIEIEKSSSTAGEYLLSVRSPSGEVDETMKFPFSPQELESSLKDIQIAILRSAGTSRLALSPESRAVQEFGRLLFNSLMVGDIRNKYAQSQVIAGSRNKSLRLKLRVKPPELASLPWEFIWDSTRGDFVCLQPDTPLVRYIEVPLPVSVLSCHLPLRILGMVSSPADVEPLKVEAEKKRVSDSLAQLAADGLVELVWLDGGTWHDLYSAMREGPWHIFHFIGHGGYDRARDEGTVLFENADGTSDPISATQLARLLVGHKDLRLVLLNSCEGARGGREDIFSSTASILLRRGIPSVLAMQYEISDQAALEFSKYFYEALASGVPVDAAVSGARIAMSMQLTDTLEWATPVLFMRSPDGVLFDIDQARRPRPLPSAPAQPLPRRGPVPAGIPVSEIYQEPVAPIPAAERHAEPAAPPVAPTPAPAAGSAGNRNRYIFMGLGAVLGLALVIGSIRAITSWFGPTPTTVPYNPPATRLTPTRVIVALATIGPTDAAAVPKSTVTAAPAASLTPTPLPDTPTPDPLRLPAVRTAIDYWTYFGDRDFESSWAILSPRFQQSNFDNNASEYINLQKSYKYCDVFVKDIRLLSTNKDTMYVLGTVVYKTGDACTEAPSKFVHIMKLSGSKWLLDRLAIGVVSDPKCASARRTLTAGGTARIAIRSGPLFVRGFPVVSAATQKYSAEYTLDSLSSQEQVKVLDGPLCGLYNEQYFWWWRVRTPRSLEGWVVEGSDANDPYFIEPVQ